MNLTALPHLGSSVTIHSRNLFIVQTNSPTEMMVVQGKEAERACCLIRQLGSAYIVKIPWESKFPRVRATALSRMKPYRARQAVAVGTSTLVCQLSRSRRKSKDEEILCRTGSPYSREPLQ